MEKRWQKTRQAGLAVISHQSAASVAASGGWLRSRAVQNSAKWGLNAVSDRIDVFRCQWVSRRSMAAVAAAGAARLPAKLKKAA